MANEKSSYLEELLKYEKLYRNAGFETGPCDPIYKRPWGKWGTKEDREKMTVEMCIEKHGERRTGLCIYTGKDSNLTVIDVDNREMKLADLRARLAGENDEKQREKIQGEIEAFENSLEDYLEVVEMCETLCVAKFRTQNDGWHYLFRYTQYLLSRAKYIPGIDGRNNGGLIVAPPSIGRNGDYRFTEKNDLQNLTPIPDELILKLNPKAFDAEETKPGGSRREKPCKPSKTGKGALIRADECIGIGERDQRIFAHFCSTRERGIDMETALADLLRKNNILMDEEWTESKIREKAERAYNEYPSDNPAACVDGPSYSFDEPQYDPNSIKDVRKRIFDIRIQKLPAHQKEGIIFGDVLNYLQCKGSIYFNIKKQTAYYFHNEKKKLCTINKGDLEFRAIMSDLGISAQDKLFNYLTDEIFMKAFNEGVRTEIRQDVHYDEDTQTVDIFDHDNQMYRIRHDGIEKVGNGTDGVLFLSNPNYEPFEYVPAGESLTAFNELLVERIYFSNDFIPVEDKKLLLRLFILYYFFCTQQNDRPLLVLVGEKGSTKTSNARRFGMVFYGSQFEVTAISRSKEDNFDVALANSRFTVIDNVDQKIDWLYDKLAVIATGGTLKRKVLYTTAELAEYPLNVFPIITTRTPKFCRDDVADRLLIMSTEKPGTFLSKKAMNKKVLKNRNLIMSEIMNEIKRILGIFRQYPEDIDTDFRIADFASFCLRIARHDGYELKMKKLLKTMNREQSRMTLERENGTLFDLIKEWTVRDSNSERFVTNAELWKELCSIADEKQIDFEYRRKNRAFYQKMGSLRSNLKEFFTIEEKSKGSNVKAYRYQIRDDAPST